MPRVTEMFCFVMRQPQDDDQDNEGVPALRGPGGTLAPMCGADMARVEAMRPTAQMIADHTDTPVRLMRFDRAQTLEMFTRSPDWKAPEPGGPCPGCGKIHGAPEGECATDAPRVEIDAEAKAEEDAEAARRSREQMEQTFTLMERDESPFVQALGSCFRHADDDQTVALLVIFGPIFAQYAQKAGAMQ